MGLEVCLCVDGAAKLPWLPALLSFVLPGRKGCPVSVATAAGEVTGDVAEDELDNAATGEVTGGVAEDELDNAATGVWRKDALSGGAGAAGNDCARLCDSVEREKTGTRGEGRLGGEVVGEVGFGGTTGAGATRAIGFTV
jgi:hypothetical protein